MTLTDHEWKVLLDAQAICERKGVKDGVQIDADSLDAAGYLRRIIKRSKEQTVPIDDERMPF